MPLSRTNAGWGKVPETKDREHQRSTKKKKVKSEALNRNKDNNAKKERRPMPSIPK